MVTFNSVAVPPAEGGTRIGDDEDPGGRADATTDGDGSDSPSTNRH